ncbi:MAG: DUF819 family protein [Candidatus Latescibacterota bacterium]|nr:MAG: DUF819 family protein [Candidatus Latescibacterota bacterium]
MQGSEVLITHPYALLAVLMLVPVMFLGLERWTQWRVFEYLPPVVWIFVFPIVLSGLRIIPNSSPTYDTFKAFAVPMFIILMLLDVDLRATMKVAIRSIGVLTFGAFGVVVGGIAAFFFFKGQLDPESWRGFGALAGSWIGGTGNLAAVAEAVDTPPTMMGIVVIADTFIFILYFPVLFACKRWAKPFARFTGVTKESARKLDEAVSRLEKKSNVIDYRDILTLFGVGFLLIWIVGHLAQHLPAKEGVFSAKTWQILILTTVALLLASTPLRKVPGTHSMSMALVYVYLSMIGAQANIHEAANAPYFLLAGILCIVLHAGFCVVGAKLFRVDVHLTAIASVACIGGAASAPVVAAYHRKELVPVAILLALAGYALGNYLGLLAAYGCRWIL